MRKLIKTALSFGLAVSMMVGMTTTALATNTKTYTDGENSVTFSDVTKVETKTITIHMDAETKYDVEATIVYVPIGSQISTTSADFSFGVDYMVMSENNYFSSDRLYHWEGTSVIVDEHTLNPLVQMVNGIYCMLDTNASTGDTIPTPNATPTASTVLVNGTSTAFDAYKLMATTISNFVILQM